MIKTSALGLLFAASGVVAQTPPDVRPVLTRAEAQGLNRDPGAVLADSAAVAALAAFVAPIQQHAPDTDPGPGSGLLAGLPTSLMVPVQVSGALLWVPVSTDAPEDAYPPGMDAGSELALDRYVTVGDAEPLTDAQAVCPPGGAGYRVWTVAGVGRVEGCSSSAE